MTRSDSALSNREAERVGAANLRAGALEDLRRVCDYIAAPNGLKPMMKSEALALAESLAWRLR